MKDLPDSFYASVFRGAPIGLAISDGQGFVVDANDYLLELGGWTREELDGMSASDFYVDGPEVRRAILDSMRNQGMLMEHGVRFRRKDGSTFLAMMSARPLIIDDAHHIVVTIRKVDA